MNDIFYKPSKSIFDSPTCDEEKRHTHDRPTPPKVSNQKHTTLRMSDRAKRRIDQLHTRKREEKQEVFKQLLEASSLTFTEEELQGHGYKSRLNVEISDDQYQRIKTAARLHKCKICVIVSALIIKEGAKL